jgi:hypothetical protein
MNLDFINYIKCYHKLKKNNFKTIVGSFHILDERVKYNLKTEYKTLKIILYILVTKIIDYKLMIQ